ncbi:MAG: C39 family peptidase [Anaerolineae bacterium]|nr:C39 family peptidase [Anaerolineae bacterium]
MKRESGRSCARLAAWLIVASLVVVVLGAVGVSVVAWQRQAGEVTRLRAQVDELAADLRLAEAQATAAALDARLVVVERAMQWAAELPVEPTAEPAVGEPAAWAEVFAEQAALAARVDELERQVAVLAAAYAAGAADAAGVASGVEPDGAPVGAGSPRPKAWPDMVRLDVEAQKQGHNLSCESSAASMAARYHGVDVSEEDVLAALPHNDNPSLGFRGNVDGAPGGTIDYGVYAAPVAAVLSSYGLKAQMVEGGLGGVRAALARGNPVVAWVTYDCLVSTPVEVTVGGELVVLVPYQHAVVVTGYDAGGVWANDPWDGGEDYYLVADFERAMGYFGPMAIEVAAWDD